MSVQEQTSNALGLGAGRSPQAGDDPPRKGPRIQGAGGLVLVGLFLAGIAGLYLLSLRNTPAAASARQKLVEAKVDAALKQLDPPAAAPQDRPGDKPGIIDRFYYDARARQIPSRDLQSNPFAFKAPPNMRKVEVPIPKEVERAKPAAVIALEQARAAVKGLRLQSVLSGARNAAMISDNLLTEGQQIRGWTVERIQSRSVVLRWKDQTVTLTMPE